MLKRLDHVGIVVDDLNDAKRLLGETFGLRLVRELEVAQLARRVAFFQCGDGQIELIEDLDSGLKAQVLGHATARIEHVAIEVDHLDSVLAALEQLGVKTDSRGVLRIGSRDNAWTDARTTDGMVFQLLSAAPE